MGFLRNFRQDPVRSLISWYNARQEMKRIQKRQRSAQLFEESKTPAERLRGELRSEKKQAHVMHASTNAQAVIRLYADTKEKRTIENKATKPWLYSSIYGIPRMVDALELRRLAETPIAQLCISTKRSFIKNTPWMIIETDPSEKMLKQIKSKYPDKRRRRKALKSARTKEFNRLFELPMEKRVLDKQFKKMREKANDSDTPRNSDIDEASQLLSSPNNTNKPFSHYCSMNVVDLEEVGSATWVLKFAPDDFEDAKTDRGIPYTRPKKNARPLEFDSFDTLQFNKDEDDFGNLMGYWHYPRGWQMGHVQKPKYMSKGEIVWFETDPRPNRPYGVSNTEKAAPDLDLNQLLLEQITAYAAEGLQSPGMLSLKGEGWTPEEFDKFKTYMQEEVKGHPEVFPIVDKDAAWIPFTQNFRESQYLERELWRAKNVAGQFQMNMTVIGLEDGNTNRATAFAHINLALDLKGAGPMLKDIEHAINTQIIWRYFAPNKEFSFLFDPALNAEERERVDVSAIRKWECGLAKKDEARSEMGMEEVGPEGGGEEFRDQGISTDTGLGLSSAPMTTEKTVVEPKKKIKPHTIIFNKNNGWEMDKVKEWCISNNYKILNPRETDKQIRIKQIQSNTTADGYIIDLDPNLGITAYVCEESTKEEQDNGSSDDLGVSGIEETDYDRLYRGVSTVYTDVFNDILAELEEHQGLFSEGKSVKVGPRELLASIISKVVKNTGLIDKTVTSITKVVGPSVLDVVREQSIELNLGLDDVDESSAIERFTQKRMPYYQDIPDTLSDEVLSTLVKGIEEGQSYQTVRNNLMAKRDDFTRARAETIARTELGRSRREAKLIFAERHEKILDKKWVSSNDHRTRKSHRAMNGTTIPIKEPFKVPYNLDNKKYQPVDEMVPGDSKQGINCRCSMVLVKKKVA